jgi:hypothetical protein
MAAAMAGRATEGQTTAALATKRTSEDGTPRDKIAATGAGHTTTAQPLAVESLL